MIGRGKGELFEGKELEAGAFADFSKPQHASDILVRKGLSVAQD